MDEGVCIMKNNTLDFFRILYINDIGNLKEHTTLITTKILGQLYLFLNSQMPCDRLDLTPGRHWVWCSLIQKLTKDSMMQLASKHVFNINDNYHSDNI